MKRSNLSLLLTTGVIATFVAIHACSSDETNEPQSMTKTQLLLKKSKEFAQKYNVDLEVDEAQLEKVADTLSVEQMERDYQAWANFTRTPITVTPKKTKSSNGLKLTKRRATYESTSISGQYKDIVDNNPYMTYELFYNFGNNGNGTVRVVVTYGKYEGMAFLQPTGFTSYGSNSCSFTAVGSINLTRPLYKTLTKRVCVEYCNTGKPICEITDL